VFKAGLRFNRLGIIKVQLQALKARLDATRGKKMGG
jgi:hypothetical protein